MKIINKMLIFGFFLAVGQCFAMKKDRQKPWQETQKPKRIQQAFKTADVRSKLREHRKFELRGDQGLVPNDVYSIYLSETFVRFTVVPKSTGGCSQWDEYVDYANGRLTKVHGVYDTNPYADKQREYKEKVSVEEYRHYVQGNEYKPKLVLQKNSDVLFKFWQKTNDAQLKDRLGQIRVPAATELVLITDTMIAFFEEKVTWDKKLVPLKIVHFIGDTISEIEDYYIDKNSSSVSIGESYKSILPWGLSSSSYATILLDKYRQYVKGDRAQKQKFVERQAPIDAKKREEQAAIEKEKAAIEEQKAADAARRLQAQQQAAQKALKTAQQQQAATNNGHGVNNSANQSQSQQAKIASGNKAQHQGNKAQRNSILSMWQPLTYVLGAAAVTGVCYLMHEAYARYKTMQQKSAAATENEEIVEMVGNAEGEEMAMSVAA